MLGACLLIYFARRNRNLTACATALISVFRLINQFYRLILRASFVARQLLTLPIRNAQAIENKWVIRVLTL